MTCINRNSKEYEELNEVLGSSELAHLVWDRNGGNMLDLDPNGEESLLFKDILELVDNDRFQALRFKAQYYLNNNPFKEWWVDYKQEPRLDVNKHKSYKDDKLSISIATTILDKLSKRFGYKWRFDSTLGPGEGGQIDTAEDGSLVVTINPLSMQFESPFHEYGHIVIAGLQKDNKELYNRLVDELHSSNEGKLILEHIDATYTDNEGKPLTGTARNVEAIAALLGKYASNTIDKSTGLFAVATELWEYIKKILADAFGIVKISELNPSTTLRKLATLIADPSITFDFGDIVFTEQQILQLANYNKLLQKQSKKPTPNSKLTADEIKNKFIEHSKQFEIETDPELDKKKGHYKFKKDNVYEYLERVTDRCAKYGHGWTGKKTDEDTLPIRVGKTIHATIENIVKDVTEDISVKHKVILTNKAKKDIEKIFKDLKGKYTALSEVIIGDVEAGLAGSIDLVLISEDGKVMLFDFKSKIRAKFIGKSGELTLGYSGFDSWGNSYKSKYSQKDNAHLQLSIYATMVEKVLGLNVTSISVVKLEAIQNGSFHDKKFVGETKNGKEVIESIRVHSEDEDTIAEPFWDSRGDLHYHNATRRIYEGDMAYLHNKSLENVTRLEKERGEFKFAKVVTESRTKAGEILDKLKDELEARINIARKRYDIKSRENLEFLVEKLEVTESVTESLEWIILNASDELSNLWDELQKYLTTSTSFTPAILYRWKDAVQSFKSLKDLESTLMIRPDIIPNKKYVNLLTEVGKMVDAFENLYKTEGRHLIAKWLTPYYNGIKAKYKEVYEAEYRKYKYREVKKKKRSLDSFEEEFGTLESYVDTNMGKDGRKIEEETFDLLYRELEVANDDINEITRWIDNMLDSSDPIASAMVNAFVQAEIIAREEAIDKKYDLIEAVEDLMRVHPKDKFQSEESYYSFMIEKDPKTGELRQNIIKPYLSTFWDDVKEYEKSQKFTESGEERPKEEIRASVKRFKSERRNWKAEEFDDASKEFVENMYKNGDITKEEFSIIIDYLNFSSAFELDRLGKLEGVGEGAISAISFWIGKNVGLFFDYADEYVNPQWTELMKKCGIDPNKSIYYQYQELKNSDNPFAKFYNFIEGMAKEADQKVPVGYRLYDRLPGVVKLNSEKFKAGQSPLTIAKSTFDTNLFVRPEDIQRGDRQLRDEKGRVKNYIPVQYTARIEQEYQSYDIPGIYFKYWDSANNYRHKREILPEMEMARFFLNSRKALERNVFKDVLSRNAGVDDDKAPLYKDKTVLAEMFNDWFDVVMYGKYTRDEKALLKLSNKKSIDLMKFVDLINRYTSLNLLGGNVVQGVANVLIGETLQTIENIAMEYVSPKSYSRATALYTYYLPSVLGDVSRNAPKSLAGKLFQEFDVLDDDVTDTMFSTNTKAGRFTKSTSIYFIQRSGEHWLQNRFLLAMLIEKQMVDLKGNSIGSLLDQYILNDGKLELKQKSELSAEEYKKFLIKNKWTEKDQLAFKIKVKGILSRTHGEYGDLGRIALQRIALGRMAYMFRKFIVPGFRRRWAGKKYIERLGQYVEGDYITTIKFFRNYWKELATLKFSVMGENWAALSDHEKANIRRATSEAAFIIASIVMISLFLGIKEDDDDEAWWVNFAAYQSLRLRSELLFYINPMEAMKILRSPMASMSVFENVAKLVDQLFDPTERYERGPWKGQLKIKKTSLDFVPLYKQVYKARDIEEQLSWWK